MKLVPIQPKGLGAKYRALPGAAKQGLRDAAERVREDFESTVAGWQHPVAFTITEEGDALNVGTDDEIWHYVDEGTKPHVIVAKHAKVLRFGVGGSPKTSKGRLKSGTGSKGGTVVFRPRVNHPGTEPRNFVETIQKRWRRGVAPFVRARIEEALR